MTAPQVPGTPTPVSYDLPVNRAAPFPRSQAAAERLHLFFAEVFPSMAAGFGVTWAILLIADCIAAAVS